MSEITFSVVIPLYNKEKSIAATIASVINQQFTDFELIIIDDGSTDASPTIVKKINDPRLRLVEQKNSGVSAARNLGIELANNLFIAFLDADDIWKNDFLFSIKNLILEFPDGDLYATHYLRGDEEAELVKPRLEAALAASPKGYMQNYFRAATFGEQPFFTSSVCVRKSTFKKTGNFKLNESHGEDLDLWARIALTGRIVFLPEPKVIYRTSAENRAMHVFPKAKPWPFREDAEAAINNGDLDKSLVEDIREHIARVELYTVVSNIINPDISETRKLLHSIRTKKLVKRKKLLEFFLLLPPSIRSFILSLRGAGREVLKT